MNLARCLPLAKYGAVVAFGFGIDFTITLMLSRVFGLCLELSAAIGFLVALAINYPLLEFWVFRAEQSALSAARLSQTALSAGTALTMRVSVIWLAVRIIGKETLPEAVAAVLMGAAASFIVNYLLLRLIFRRAPAPA